MFAIIFLAAFEAMAVTTIMPLVARDLDGESLFALAFAVPLAAGIIGMVIAGNWTDRSGPLPSLITSAVLFVVGLVIAGTAVNMEVFIVGRFVHGLSGAAVIVPLYVIVGRVYPEHLRARVFAGFAAAWVIPSIIGPALAGVVAETLSWHWVFLGVIVLRRARRRDDAAADPARARPGAGRPVGAVEPQPRRAGRCSPRPRRSSCRSSKELGDPWRWVVAIAAIAVAAVAARPLLPAGNAARGSRHAGDGDAQAHRRRRVLRQRDLPALPLHRALRLLAEPRGRGAHGRRRLVGGGVVAAGPAHRPRLEHAGGRDRCRDARRSRSRSCWSSRLFTLAPAIAFVAWTLAGAAMGFMYPRFSVAVLALSPVSAQGFNSAALTISESLGAAIALAITALVSSAAGAGMFTADFAVTFAIAVVALVLAGRVPPPAAASAVR